MKVGTDGMLLGALAETGTSKKILDIGTGSGLVALMLAQRSKAKIHALEIEENAYLQAAENIGNSMWSNRIQAYHASLQEFAYMPTAKNAYDLLISNPPFFEQTTSAKSTASTIERAIARDHRSLTYAELACHASQLLVPGGTFYLILPFDQSQNFIQLAHDQGLQLEHYILVRSKKTKPFHRGILGFVKTNKSIQPREQVFTIYEENGLYTEQYLRATAPYHAADVSGAR